ncbi:MAG: hypothetical protein WCX77_02130 [Candidatus Paceibacterota bacterium]|jgi:hypothetical protein
MNKTDFAIALFVVLAIIGSGYAGLTASSWNPYTRALEASTEAYGQELMAQKEAQMDYLLNQKVEKDNPKVCVMAQIDEQRGIIRAISSPSFDECLHSNKQGL